MTEIREDGEGALIMGKTGVTTKAPKTPRPKAPKPVQSDKVLIFSEGNIHWPNIAVPAGYSVVSKEVAETVLKHRKVREATVDEVKEYYSS